jgi:hypothetical protein
LLRSFVKSIILIASLPTYVGLDQNIVIAIIKANIVITGVVIASLPTYVKLEQNIVRWFNVC